jgi:hypothetical protein
MRDVCREAEIRKISDARRATLHFHGPPVRVEIWARQGRLALPAFGTPGPKFGTPLPKFGTLIPKFGTPGPKFGTPGPKFGTSASQP